jgi:serine/threonine protein kinase
VKAQRRPGLSKPMLGQPLGPFVLKGVLGEGAMGLVYRAVRESNGEVVAVKILKHRLSRDELYKERFRREARVAQQVRHPHLVPVVEAGEDEGIHYLAMSYVEGMSLGEWIEQEGQLPIRACVRTVREVASGLDALHSEGLVHRDVKPSNIMLDRAGTAALTDFGLARGRAFTVLTKPGEVMGTPDYIAPELISGAEAGPLSDVYALGCVAYECFTGKPPFAGRTLLEVAVAHMDEEPPGPRAHRPELPSDLAWSLLQALAKDPARRPPTALAYARLLKVGAESS